jgi:hypothetical protein
MTDAREDYREYVVVDNQESDERVRLRFNDHWGGAALNVDEGRYREDGDSVEIFLTPDQLETLASAALALRDRILALQSAVDGINQFAKGLTRP